MKVTPDQLAWRKASAARVAHVLRAVPRVGPGVASESRYASRLRRAQAKALRVLAERRERHAALRPLVALAEATHSPRQRKSGRA